MSHAIYQTDALVLRTKNTKESNKLVYLYTEKFGLIYANMQSLRELKSKMRYHVHPYSLVEVDLVSGRNIWHLTGIHEKKSAFGWVDTPWYRLLSLVSEILIRLCVGEEKNDDVWIALEKMFYYFSQEHHEYENEIEIIFLVLLLDALGYWPKEDLLLEQDTYTKEIFLLVRKNRLYYVNQINQSLRDSQL